MSAKLAEHFNHTISNVLVEKSICHGSNSLRVLITVHDELSDEFCYVVLHDNVAGQDSFYA